MGLLSMKNLKVLITCIIYYFLVYSLIIFATLCVLCPFIQSPYWFDLCGKIIHVIGSINLFICYSALIRLLNKLAKTLDDK
jgi:hypothetical protein